MKQINIRQFAICCGLFAVSVFGNFSPVAIAPAMAETELAKTITVTGNGEEKIPTTQARVQLGVEIQGKTATQVQQQVARRISAVVDLLRANNVEQLQTVGFGLRPDYNRIDGQSVLRGYIGTNTVSFRIQTDRIGNLLDEAVEAGASRIDEVSFTATPEAISAAREEALRQAGINARAKADVVLDALNLTSQEIVSIQVDNANIVQPRPFNTRQLAVDEASIGTPIIGGEQTVRASVTLQISY